MKKIIKIIYLVGLIYLIVGTLSVLYSHYILDGLMVSNKFDLFTRGFFNLSSYLGIILYYFLGQKIFFYVICQCFIVLIYYLIFKSIKSIIDRKSQ
jgi:hypothetical protein